MRHERTPQRLAGIVTRLEPWFQTRLCTITIWPTTDGGWEAVVGYAHYTKLQPGETPPADVNLTYPRATRHPLALEGADTDAVVRAQVQDLERTGHVGACAIRRFPEPPWMAPGSLPLIGWTIVTHSGTDAERRAWQRHIGQDP